MRRKQNVLNRINSIKNSLVFLEKQLNNPNLKKSDVESLILRLVSDLNHLYGMVELED